MQSYQLPRRRIHLTTHDLDQLKSTSSALKLPSMFCIAYMAMKSSEPVQEAV
jgi:hypothetical protein